jgi:hypothetical protein
MKKTLIYIIGAGRSGTTLLDIILGNNTESISLGEVNRLYKREGIPPKRAKDDKVNEFWKEITNSLDQTDLSYLELADLFHNNEYHSAFLKSIFKNSNLLYRQNLNHQYDVLKTKTEQSILIESSKYPVRALNISEYVSKDNYIIKYIYLKKDPTKVVKSFQKNDLEQPSKSFFSANLYYLLVNLLCVLTVKILKFRNHKVSIIKYEDLLIDSKGILKKLSDDLDVDFSILEDKLEYNKLLKTGYLFDGNRIRLKETLTLRVSDKIVIKNGNYYFTRIFNYIVYR